MKECAEKHIESIEYAADLDKLINDKDWLIRRAMAKQGYGLDKLVNDEYWRVREEVAKQGYGLTKLIDDPDINVREAAQEYINKHPEKHIEAK